MSGGAASDRCPRRHEKVSKGKFESVRGVKADERPQITETNRAVQRRSYEVCFVP